MTDGPDLMQQNASQASGLLRSMANESRLMILCLLSQREMTVSDLLREVPLSQSALSQHLGVLRRDKLVKTRRQSQFVWYSLAGAKAQRVIELLYELYCEGDADA